MHKNFVLIFTLIRMTMNRSLSILLFLLFISVLFVWQSKRVTERKHNLSQNINVLHVGTNAEYPPFSFRENNKIVGFDIDIIKEIAKRLNKEIIIKDLPFEALLPKLQLGELHVLAAGMTPTKERAKKILFTKPYVENDPLLIITLNSTPALTSLEDLKGKNIVVNEGYTSDLYLSEFEAINIIRLATPAEAILALQSKRADAFVAAQSSVQLLLKKWGISYFQIAPLANTTEKYALAISQHHLKLLPLIQEVLDDMNNDGTLTSLKKKWKLS
jgi:ABC-type amino acid transport substrate-binding protein